MILLKTRFCSVLQTKVNGIKMKSFEASFHFSLAIFCLLMGFFMATFFATILGFPKNWNVLNATFLVILIEVTGFFLYGKTSATFNLYTNKNLHSNKKKNINLWVANINYLKIGLIFGLFVDAFKLGS
uniref:Hypothetical chloroplast RF20 n=1 Tax=Chlorokybus atmophyticus TaxID=3144 RepID=A2CI67_CHLAT|nr:hypothetical chloroplast RF20 [Chlorokybus atmophyticus]ABM87970.1 hypothetical chloroplast RF20 [Chlorokybus atmophyticus]WKT05658.1 hypothetical chloroplast RF20 [Chlorokybus atmophyticus]